MLDLESTNRPPEPSPLEIHLFWMTQEEAEACFEHHGTPKACSDDGCDNSPDLVILFKRPGAEWAQEVQMSCACNQHRAPLESMFRLGEKT